jgi:hypothetical protein
MPFNSPSDYYEPTAGIRTGLALGEAMARRKYQDQAAAIAERRAAMEEQEQLAREVKVKEQAIALHEERAQYDEFKGKFNSFLGEEIGALPEDKRQDPTEFENAQRRAARKALPYAPANMLGKILDSDLKQQAMDDRNAVTQDAITARVKAGVDARFGLQEERLAALERRDAKKIESQEKIAYDQMDSREYIKQMEIDAKAARSEDEYVLKLAPSYINKMGVAPVKADRELRARYRQIHGEKDMPAASEDPAAGESKKRRIFKVNPKTWDLD